MEKTGKVGICMDHSHAIVMGLSNGTIKESIVLSESLLHDEEYTSDLHEKMRHNKEQHQKSGYYSKLCDIIRNYGDVILFGPTDAKSELLNLLKADHLFSKIRIEILNSDKMTKNQMHAFVKKYFR